MLEVRNNLNVISKELSVPDDVKGEVSDLFRQATEENLLRGRSAENILSGALYAACRRNGCPRTFSEIAEKFGTDEKRVYSGYKHIVRNLDINVPPIDSSDCIPHLIEKLGLDETVKERALDILEETSNGSIASGRCPFGLAAAAIYIAGYIEGKKRSQREVKEVAKVSEVTVRSRFKEIVKDLGIEINAISN